MKRACSVLLVATTALVTLTGCATNGFVRSEVDPLADRLGRLETEVHGLAGQIGQTGGSVNADQAAIQQANEKAQQALDRANSLKSDVQAADGKAQQALNTANKLTAQVKQSDESAKSAEAAANRAEAAAREAEGAAKNSEKEEGKSEKIFKLEQKK